MEEKIYLTSEEQVLELKNRGMEINNEDKAIKILDRINYYNLINGYKKPFIEDKFKEGTKLDEVYAIYTFDKNISRIYFNNILIIENVIKTIISDVFSKSFGHKNQYYLKKENFDFTKFDKSNKTSTNKKYIEKECEIEKLIQKLNRYIYNDTRAKSYIIHYKDQHNYVPLWVLVNVMTFGDICKFYKLMNQRERIKVSQKLSIHKNKDGKKIELLHKDLELMLYMLEDFRNIAAHGEKFYTLQTKNSSGIRYTLRFPEFEREGKKITHIETSLFALTIVMKLLLEEEQFNILLESFIKELENLKHKLQTIDYEYILHKMDFISNDIQFSTIDEIKSFFKNLYYN